MKPLAIVSDLMMSAHPRIVPALAVSSRRFDPSLNHAIKRAIVREAAGRLIYFRGVDVVYAGKLVRLLGSLLTY